MLLHRAVQDQPEGSHLNDRHRQLAEKCPELPEEQITELLERLDDRYFNSRSLNEVADDLRRLAELDGPGSFVAVFKDGPGLSVVCTLYGFDFSGVFSLIVGVLSASGLNIEEGTIHTFSRKTEKRTTRTYRGQRHREVHHTRELPRKIIDRFQGRLPPRTGLHEWRQRCLTMLEGLFSSVPVRPQDNPEAARRKVYDLVADALSRLELESDSVLYPVHISFDNTRAGATRLTVVSEDTPFFLFSLSNALSLCGVSIEAVRIGTRGSRVEDEIDIVDASLEPVTGSERMNQIRLSVLLTKQFTYFLGAAPNPHSALLRFESITRDLLAQKTGESLHSLLSNPTVLADLSRILGASDFLWEEFVRVQYENLLPVLDQASRSAYLSHEGDELEAALKSSLDSASSPPRGLNDFKNREIYLIDLDHIVHPEADFRFLSLRLSRLAETVVAKAVELAERRLYARYGEPTSFAGLPARYAIMGLGKLGGEALGYASDIELMFVYADNGTTTGPISISNSEYFERCFKTATNMIEAKQEGIFRIDLRLRPYGADGPIACSLESFCRYYAPDGRSHSYERLALVRMRAIGGDPELGARIERIRDEMVYSTDSIDVDELRKLREKQLQEKTAPGRVNAKFSAGGLVDLEYSVQIIQCRYGKSNPALRTPRIHEALEELVKAGLMSGTEADDLVTSYQFLRRLINGLRMLRGSAVDLFLPDVGSDEYLHLARRAGYTGEPGLTAAQQLHLQLETRMALIRRFIESRLGRDSIPGPPVGNAADLALSDSLPAELRTSIIADAGFRNPVRAYRNVLSLRGTGSSRQRFAKLAVLAWDVLRSTPDPDMALNNWERFAGSLQDRESHFAELLDQPLRIEVLLSVFAASQFLADTIVRNPDFLRWVSAPELLHAVRTFGEVRTNLEALADRSADAEDWRRGLRRFRKREILRIGMRDICLGVPLQDIVMELSNLADAVLDTTLRRIWAEIRPGESPEDIGFCILAFGKLGGRELNYSSDIDILAVYDDQQPDGRAAFDERLLARVVERMRSELADYTAEGFVYRVDLRLRPYGRSGRLVSSASALLAYYESAASPWELQAAIKLRPVAGDHETGSALRDRILKIAVAPRPATRIFASITELRDRAVRSRSRLEQGTDIKSGKGGIRDIEFLVQGLQLLHGHRSAALMAAGTLDAIDRLHEAGLLDRQTVATLKDAYLYLRRIEHVLQLLEDRQVHTVPAGSLEQEALARRLHGRDADAATLMGRIEETMNRVRAVFERVTTATR